MSLNKQDDKDCLSNIYSLNIMSSTHHNMGMGKSLWRFFSKIKVFFLEY